MNIHVISKACCARLLKTLVSPSCRLILINNLHKSVVHSQNRCTVRIILNQWNKVVVAKLRSYGTSPKVWGGGGPEAEKAAREALRQQSLSIVYYIVGTAILFLGFTYLAVPAYRVFCQATSLGGTVKRRGNLWTDKNKLDGMKPVKNRLIKISFEASTGGGMSWEFKPLQNSIYVHPGETALAFYTATNPTDSPIVGISTYNVLPYDAGRFFSKVQCFCFEEQLLNPGEELDMPVFFYIDEDFASAPEMEGVNEILLSYTFFESKHGTTWNLPKPDVPNLPFHFGKPGQTELSSKLDA